MEEAGMNWRRWLRPDIVLTLVAAAAGIAGAVLGGQYLRQRAADAESRIAQRYQGRQVIVAATDLARGTQLSARNIALRSVPEEYLPASALSGDRAGELLGAAAAVDLSRGTPIVPAMLVAGAAAPRLSAALAPDERALTVAVDDLNSQAGGLRSGDRIDLYFSRREGDSALLVPLLQQVEILGVGDSFPGAHQDDGPRQFSTVTLRVPAVEAPRILLAQQAGELSLLLRPVADLGVQPTTIRSSSELLRPAARGRAMADVELLVGGQGELVPERRTIRVGASRTGGAT